MCLCWYNTAKLGETTSTGDNTKTSAEPRNNNQLVQDKLKDSDTTLCMCRLRSYETQAQRPHHRRSGGVRLRSERTQRNGVFAVDVQVPTLYRRAGKWDVQYECGSFTLERLKPHSIDGEFQESTIGTRFREGGTKVLTQHQRVDEKMQSTLRQ